MAFDADDAIHGFAPDAMQVEVRIWRAQAWHGGAELRLCVRDYGPGMDAAQMRRAMHWLSTRVEEEHGSVSRRLDGEQHWKCVRQ
jgi:hypothetical protein